MRFGIFHGAISESLAHCHARHLLHRIQRGRRGQEGIWIGGWRVRGRLAPAAKGDAHRGSEEGAAQNILRLGHATNDRQLATNRLECAAVRFSMSLGLCGLLVLSACSRRPAQKKTQASPPTEGMLAMCDAQRPHVAALYRVALRREMGGEAPTTTNVAPRTSALQKDILDANVDMVLADCRKAPSQRAPCVASADSAERLERFCVELPDDAGTLEARQFSPSR